MSALFSRIWMPCLALSLGMSVVAQVYASDAHGHGEPAAKASSQGAEAAEPSIRPNLKALAQKSKAERAEKEGSAAEKAGEKPGDKGGDKAADKGAKAPQAASGAEGPGAVSMSELRDLIDQKVAEVRAKQATAPVVQVKARSPAPKAKPKSPIQPVKFAPGAESNIPTPHGAPKVSSGALATMTPDPHGHDVHWAYSGDTGPESWGVLKPEFRTCMLGKRQSPIDIRDGLPVQLDPIQFDYRPTGFRVIDNGHTIQANVDPGNSIIVQGRRYELLQFHFHRPSEERINGKQFDMVAHLVHKDTDGKLAVVAVLIEQGAAHPALQLVWNALPLEKKIEQASSVPIDLNMILPERKNYFTYMGSLTTPPCSEGVLWMVLKQPAQMSREQINIFSRMYPMNARPVQSAQGRMIKDGQ